MDLPTLLLLIGTLAAVVAALAAWGARADFLGSEIRKEQAERRADVERSRYELEMAASTRSSAESLAALAKAFLEAKDQDHTAPEVTEISAAKQARIDFGADLRAWVDRFERTHLGNERTRYPDDFLRFGNRAHTDLADTGAFWLVQWMLGLVLQSTMGFSAPALTQEAVSILSDQMRYLIRAWIEDPDLFVNLNGSSGTIGW